MHKPSQVLYIEPETDVHNPEHELLDLEGYSCRAVHSLEDAKKLLADQTFRFIMIDIRDDFIEDLTGWRSRCLEFIYDSNFHKIRKVVICTDMKSIGTQEKDLRANSVIHFHLIEDPDRLAALISTLRKHSP